MTIYENADEDGDPEPFSMRCSAPSEHDDDAIEHSWHSGASIISLWGRTPPAATLS